MIASEVHGLSTHQRAVGDRIVAEEGAKREHVVVYLSGAHAFGFPSPDEGLDLKAVHVAPTGALVGLTPPQPSYERSDVFDGVTVAYASNEIAHVLSGVLDGNGSFVERLLGRTALATSPALEELRPLVRASLSRRLYRHYRALATNQAEALEVEPTVERLLYVLRTALTGTHLLRTGELETNLFTLADAYELRDVRELVEARRAGERTSANPAVVDVWRGRVEEVLGRLDSALQRSVLPEEPRDVVALEGWLLALRKARF